MDFYFDDDWLSLLFYLDNSIFVKCFNFGEENTILFFTVLLEFPFNLEISCGKGLCLYILQSNTGMINSLILLLKCIGLKIKIAFQIEWFILQTIYKQQSMLKKTLSSFNISKLEILRGKVFISPCDSQHPTCRTQIYIRMPGGSLFNNIPHYSFSTPVGSQRYPKIVQLKRHLQELKVEKGQHNFQYIKQMHDLTLLLAVQKLYTQAIEVSSKVICLFQEYYKTSDKQLIQQAQKVMFYKTLSGLYKAVNDFENNIKTGEKIVGFCLQNSKMYRKFQPLIVQQYINMGQAYLAQDKADDAVKMFQDVLNFAQGQKDQRNKQKVIYAKSQIGDILLNTKSSAKQSRLALQQCLILIHNTYTQKFPVNLLCRPLFNLTQIYFNTRQTLSLQQTTQYLSQTNKYCKQISLYYLNNNLEIQELLTLYNNLGCLYTLTKDYNKSLQCYKFVKEHLVETNTQAISANLYNQAINYALMKRSQKAIQKLVRAYQIREQVSKELQLKKRKSSQDLRKLEQNRQKLKEIAVKTAELYRSMKDEKKSNQWTLKI